jgi:long-chain acyl-CoA synthetase
LTEIHDAQNCDRQIVDVFWRRAKDTPEKQAILHKIDGAYTPVIWREHARVVELTLAGLAKNGIVPGCHVAILSQACAKWTWADFAILSLGAATVPIYPTLAVVEVEYLVKHSDVVAVFAEDMEQLKKLLARGHSFPKLKFVVLFKGEAPPSPEQFRILTWQDLLADGEVYLPTHGQELENYKKQITPESLASIVYTSGTTGVPKGVMLSHANIFSVVQAATRVNKFKETDLALSFLPLSHVYERVGGQFLTVYAGIAMAYAEAIETVPQNMVETHPTVVNGVPRFYEKAYQRIKFEARKLPKAQQIIIHWALGLSRYMPSHKSRNDTETEHSIIKQLHVVELRTADRLVFSKIRRRFGGRLRLLVSGAAPLPPDVQAFFDLIGLPIVEGYGLTETAAPLACNTLENNRPGTVGKPLEGILVKIAEDGELLVKGPSVFSGYYKNPEATQEAFEDGWFKTGDIAEIDKDGYIAIKDRKKDIIITAGGKHIAPQFIENLFKGEQAISHCLVYGDRRKYVSCLFTLNPDWLKHFAESNKIDISDKEAMVKNELVRKEVEAAMVRINAGLANYERIKNFAILADDFTIDAGELTPTFKVKRKFVTNKYKELLDGLYPAEDIEIEHRQPGKAHFDQT